MRHRTRIPRNVLFLFGILGLAFGLRFGLARAHPFSFPDSVDYDELAKALLHGRYDAGGHVAARMPGYPLFVAGVYWISFHSQLAVLAVQALLSVATVALTYAIARRIHDRIGLLAAGMLAIDPLSVGFSAALLTETAYTFLLLASLWLGLRLIERRRWLDWLGFGLLWGIGVYFRASALWCIVPLGAVILWAQHRRAPNRAQAGVKGVPSGMLKQAAGGFAALAIVVALLIPWWARNYAIFHSGFFRMTTLEGISLYEAVYTWADGGPQQHLIKTPPEMLPLDEAQRSDEWARRGWGFVRAEPLRILKLAAIKIARTWTPLLNAEEFRSPVLQGILAAWYAPLFVFAIIGAGLRRLPKEWAWLLFTPILYFTAVHALYLGSVRYRAPLMPIVCVFAAIGLETMSERFARKRGAEPGV